jgi:NitT/TauT family transport system substrate-binding protein
LVTEKDVPPLTFEKWLDDTYVKKAYAARGQDYAELKSTVVTPKVDDPTLKPAEMWIDGEGIASFDSIKAMTEAYAAAIKAGKKVNATYVYDKATGLKLFGHVAFYVKQSNGDLVAFMKKGDADAFKTDGASLVTWGDVI